MNKNQKNILTNKKPIVDSFDQFAGEDANDDF